MDMIQADGIYSYPGAQPRMLATHFRIGIHFVIRRQFLCQNRKVFTKHSRVNRYPSIRVM